MNKSLDEYQLCYVDGKEAYFTDDFEHQWGDDWNDAPYEHNAGEPYDSWYDDDHKEHKINIYKVYFEIEDYWRGYEPCSGTDNSRYTVEQINKGAIAWIKTDDFFIKAGTTYKEFVEIIKSNNGKIFVEI